MDLVEYTKSRQKLDSLVERYKGYTQEYDMDYKEAFAPITTMTTIRTLIVVASIFQWKIFQMDVKNAFLNGDLHGLKEAHCAWFQKFIQ